jgi:hypothetical protein
MVTYPKKEKFLGIGFGNCLLKKGINTMKIYKTQKEFEKGIKDGRFFVKDDIDITAFNLNVEADIDILGEIFAADISARSIRSSSINAGNITALDIMTGHIYAKNINVRDIRAHNIYAREIKARDISAWDITAENIIVGDIKADDINAKDIKAWDIKARNINARDVIYYAIAIAHENIKVRSIIGGRKNAKHLALDGKLEIEGWQKVVSCADGNI